MADAHRSLLSAEALAKVDGEGGLIEFPSLCELQLASRYIY